MPQMRKALFVMPVDAPGGAERVIATTALEMTRRGGWDITIVSLSQRLEISFLDQLGDHITVRYGEGRGAFPSEWPALLQLPKEEFDLVFSSHFRVNAALSMARRLGLLKTRRLVTRESTVLTDRSKGARLLAYKTLYQTYGAQDEIWAQTSYMAERVKEVLPRSAAGKVRVMPNPVDVDAVRRRAAEPLPAELASRLSTKPHIAWCGRLIDIKNPLLAVEALARLRSMGQLDANLMMIGTGPLESDVRAAALHHGVGDQVLLVGHRRNPHPLMRACIGGLLTSRREGFPNVLLEMMAVGVPKIVTTPCAGDLDTLSGIEVADASPAALARALSDMTRTSGYAGEYESALKRRSPEAFVASLVGEPATW